jgi:hypothetical protein
MVWALRAPAPEDHARVPAEPPADRLGAGVISPMPAAPEPGSHQRSDRLLQPLTWSLAGKATKVIRRRRASCLRARRRADAFTTRPAR